MLPTRTGFTRTFSSRGSFLACSPMSSTRSCITTSCLDMLCRQHHSMTDCCLLGRLSSQNCTRASLKRGRCKCVSPRLPMWPSRMISQTCKNCVKKELRTLRSTKLR
uniref:Orf 00954 protein n=1 Tax=Saccharomyces cerevisiae TaxID=4932 RepID=E9PA64_YEASX|nr:orf 00954 [Saccharomyces cerevisiae]